VHLLYNMHTWSTHCRHAVGMCWWKALKTTPRSTATWHQQVSRQTHHRSSALSGRLTLSLICSVVTLQNLAGITGHPDRQLHHKNGMNPVLVLLSATTDLLCVCS